MSDLALTAAGRIDGTDPRARLQQAARAFEAHFIAELLKPLTERDEATEELFGSDPGSEQFRGLFVTGLTEHAAGGLGVAEIIERTMAERLRL